MLTINNTLDGYLKDVEIKGNTIQDASNLADIRSVGDKVEGQELYEIPVLSVGKNLFNGKWERGYALNLEPSSLLYGKTQAGENYSTTQDFIKVSPNETYYFTDTTAQRWVVFYDKDKKPISHDQRWGNCVIPNNTAYIKFYDHNTRVDAFPNYSVSTIDNVYEPYQEDKLTILSPVQLEKVGDVRDRIICKDGVWGVEKNVGDIKLENLDIESISTTDTTYRVYLTKKINIKTPCNYGWGTSLCNMLPFVQGEYYTKDEEHYYLEDTDAVFLFIDKNKFDGTKEGLNKYLEGKGYVIKYQLATPQFIPLPHDQQVKLRTFASKTNISFLTEIEGTIKAQVPKSLGATVNTHTEQINNLNKELDRVKKLEESTVSTVTTESDFTTVEATSNGYFEDVKLEGKTLVNVVKSNGLNYIQDDGGFKIYATQLTGCIFKPNTVYTIITTSEIEGVYLHPVTDLYGYKPMSNKMCVFTSKEQNISDNVQINFRNKTDVPLDTKVIILEGDHTQNPPSYFEGLKSVGQSATTSEDGVDEIAVESVKGDGNLFDGKWIINNINSAISENFIPINRSKQYKIITDYNSQFNQINFKEYDNNFNHIQDSGYAYGKTESGIFTPSSNCSYVKIHADLSSKASEFIQANWKVQSVDIIDNIQYNSHQSNKKPLLYYNNETQTWEKPILREWDSIEKHADGKYYYHQRSGEVVLDGEQGNNWQLEKTNTNTLVLRHPNLKCIKNNENINVICDKFKPVKHSVGWVLDSECIHISVAGELHINISRSNANSLEDALNFLNSANITVVYQLAEEKVYECTNIDLITYANETNYIVESGAIVPKTTLKVHNNISNVVSLLQKKVSLLENNITSYMITQNRLMLSSRYNADTVSFKVDVATLRNSFEYDNDLYELILNNILVGKDNYNREYIENLIIFYWMDFVISDEMYSTLFGIIEEQHNPKIIEEETPLI